MADAKIFIVEDNAAIAAMIGGMLKKLGYTVLDTEAYGEKACDKVAALKPELVLMDIFLAGEMDGIATAAKIQSKFEIPVIYLTASSDFDTLHRAKETDPFGYIIKPVDPNILYSNIEMALYKHQMDQKLKANERLLSVTLKSIGDGVISTDSENIIKFINAKAADITGWSIEEALEQELCEVFQSAQGARNPLCLIDTEKKAESLNHYTILFARDGKIKNLEINNAPLLNDSGETIGNVLIFRDISERIRADAMRRKIFMQNIQLLASIPLILISLNKNNLIKHWNNPAQKAFGIKDIFAIGTDFFDSEISWDWNAMKKCIDQCRKTGNPAKLQDFRYIRSDKREGFLKITVSPFGNEDIGKSSVLIVGEDITERRSLENQLTQAQKLESIGQLAAGIAHEINTPIQYLSDNLAFLQESFNDILTVKSKFDIFQKTIPKSFQSTREGMELNQAITELDLDYLAEEIPTAVSHSKEGLEYVTKIVKGMRDFSHPKVRKKVCIDINKAILSTITVARHEWKNIAEIETQFDKDLPQIFCYPGELNQVILNIVINATHAIEDLIGTNPDEKGKITITTQQNNEYVEIRVKDSGTGIPKNIQSKIFDPFFSTKDVNRGTGQGLSISYSVIVEKHHGNLTFETESGKGTTFLIQLPIQSEETFDKGEIDN